MLPTNEATTLFILQNLNDMQFEVSCNLFQNGLSKSSFLYEQIIHTIEFKKFIKNYNWKVKGRKFFEID